MCAKTPIKSYLAIQLRTHRKSVVIALITILIVGVALAIGRAIPAITNIFSEHMLNEFVVDIPVKLVILTVPIILFFKSKTHKEWQEAHQDIQITKKDFATATYLEIFLSTFVGVPVLFTIWIVAVLVDHSIIENILTIGVFNLGAGFFLIWMMTALVYTLRFTKLAKINQGAVLLVICLFASLWTTMGLQSLLFSMEMPFAMKAVICMLIGLVVIVIGWSITTKLYAK
ncbi:MAG: hypothetical protein FWF78_01540 [Defluviitaleaceae bacterium]|nr:hypothetical protein [Defluviitaleaceae bacterium]